MIADKIKALLPADLPVTVGDLPAPNVEAIGLMEYDGAVNTEYFGPRSGSSIHQPIIKVVLRSKSYETATNWVEAIKHTLHRYCDETFLSIMMTGTTMYLGKNDQKYHEFQIVFTTRIKE